MLNYQCKPLNKTLAALITPIIKRRGLTQAAIIFEWDKIVHKLAHHCLPIKLKFPYQQKTEGTLYLWVNSGSALQLEYAKDMIIMNINTYFGYKAVTELRFLQTDLKLVQSPHKSFHKEDVHVRNATECLERKKNLDNVNDITCQKLRDTLIAFGQTMGCIATT